jgi:hypothetical protein
MITAVRGDANPSAGSPTAADPSSWLGSSTWLVDHANGGGSYEPGIAEGGPHQVFETGTHPTLSIDIGYADLTILTRDGSQIDVAVSRSTDFGALRATAPIWAHQHGEAVRIGTHEQQWTIGDNRMVTVIVPPATQVNVVNAGDIKVSGLRAETTINSAGRGNITVADFAGPGLHVTSSDGRVSLHGIKADRLDVTSSDGRVEGTALDVRDGNVESSDGNVALGFAAGADTLVSAETSDGSIRVSGFANASNAGVQRTTDDDDDSSTQTVRVGAGNGRLRVHSSDGNIDLSQEG